MRGRPGSVGGRRGTLYLLPMLVAPRIRPGCPRLAAAALAGLTFTPAVSLGGPVRFEGSAAEMADRGAGWRTVRTHRADLTGDGRPEEVVIQSGRPGLRLSVLAHRGGDADDEDAFRALHRQIIAAARRVVRLDVEPVAGAPAPDVIAVFEAPSPDERVLNVRVVGQGATGMRSFLEKTYLVSASPPASRFRYGDEAPHFTFENLDDHGDLEILWTLGPQTLEVDGPTGPVEVVVGARQQVLRFDRRQEVYVEGREERFRDFLPPRVPTQVEASLQVPKIWGTAQAFWGADGDLESSWALPAARAVGQTLTLRFGQRPEVGMIRVVPGCASGADEWARNYRVDRFRVQLSSGLTMDLRADGRGPWPRGVRGRGAFALDGGFGRQLLVFLDGRVPIDWARLEVLSTKPPRRSRGRRAKEACISEISLH